MKKCISLRWKIYINIFFNVSFFYYVILISNDRFNSTILLNNEEATTNLKQHIYVY